MNESQAMEQILLDISNHTTCLAHNITNHQLATFLKQEWFTFSQNQVKKQEQLYVWELVHGWTLDKIGEGQNILQEDIKFRSETLTRVEEVNINEDNYSEKASLQFINKNQVVIQQSTTLFWINPIFSQKHSSFLIRKDLNPLVVLTVSDLKHLFSLLTMISIRPDLKIITLETIYKRLKILLNFLSSEQPQKYQDIQIGTTYFLKVDEYFNYGGFLWLPKHCLWYEPTFNLIISPNKSKNTEYLVQSPKLTQIKYIYYGWKKGLITQTNYQKYTSKEIEGALTPEQGKYFQISDIEVPDPKRNRFLEFIKKQLISELQDQQRQELWECCEQLELAKGQTIAHQGTLFDFVFVLFQGTFEYSAEGCKPIKIEKNIQKYSLYGLQELRKGLNHYKFTLKALSDCFTFRIQKQNFKFLLYDYF